MKRSLAPIETIAINTFREAVRGKIIYSMAGAMVILVLVAMCFGMVSVGDQVKVVKDFGLFAMSLAAAAFSVIAGSNFLHKELARKTVYNLLSKPVERWQFLTGKYLGMLATVWVLIAAMGASLTVLCALLEGTLDSLLLVSYAYVALESVIVCAAAIFFSAIVVTPMLGGLVTFGLFLAGRSAEYFLYFVRNGETPGSVAAVLNTLYWTLPNLAQLNISNRTVYGEMPSLLHMSSAAAYAGGYATALLVLAVAAFRRRDFN